MANKTGSRLKCAQCGGEVIVTRAGDGEVRCCGQKMDPK
jgi:desulfoferrodoxin-like iron-binding protein